MIPTQADIIVIGAGLTGLTAAFRLKEKVHNVHIIECMAHVGGQIHSHKSRGFTFESGPNTGTISTPEVAELFRDINDDCHILTARKESEIRYIWKGNRFRTLPSGLFSAIATPLFSWYDKFRILGEPFRAVGQNPDESVGELARRRLGQSYLDYAVDPFLSGIYAGDPMTLVTRHALPKLYHLEQDYGGFIRGAIAKARQPKSDRDRLATKKVFSAVGGMSSITDALAEKVGSENITLSASNAQVKPIENGWSVSFNTPDGNKTITAKKVISTVGAYNLPALFPFIDEKEMNKITNLNYAPVAQVAVGIKDIESVQIKGFGGLVPSREKRNVLGILFPSAIFDNRAPENGAMLSFFIGGMRRKELVSQSDAKLEALVEKELHEMLKLPKGTQPDLIRIFRHKHAIPQYEQNSGERFDAIKKIERTYQGLYLVGNIKDGISMANRITQATELSNNIAF
jgi:protoporphyrinogen oxidase